MNKFSADEIRKGAEAFAAAQKAKLEELRAQPIRNGRVYYKNVTLEPRVVAAHVADGKERTWTALGATCRDAYNALLSQLEKRAGCGDETVKVLLGVIDGPPGRARRRSGPAQGGLL